MQRVNLVETMHKTVAGGRMVRFDAFDDDAMEADLPGSRAQQLPLAIDKLPPASQVARRAIASRHRLGLRAPTSYVTHACLPHLQERHRSRPLVL